MEKLLLFLLLLFASIFTTDRGQAASDMAFYFGAHSVNPAPGVFPMNEVCKNSKRVFLTVTVVVGEGEERVCPVSPPSHETAIDIDQTPLQTAPTITDVGGGHDDSSRSVDGGAVERGGGRGPYGGGDDPGGEGLNGDSNTDRNSDGDDNERNGDVVEILSRFQRKTLKKLAKISISIASHNGITLVALPRDKPTFIVYLVVAITVYAYFFWYFSIILEKQTAAVITYAFTSIFTMDRGQAASDMAFYFGVHSVNPVPGVFLMKGVCKNSKRVLLTVTVVEGEGEERVCPVSPPSHETAIDIEQTPLQTAPTIIDVGGEHEDNSRIFVRRGGGGPGGGGDDPGGEGPNGNSNTDRNNDGDDNERNRAVVEILSRFQRKTLKKLAKISISIAAQTGIALVALPREKPAFIVYLVVAITVCAYFFCYFSIISEKQTLAAITAAIGTLFAAIGFLLTMCIIVLPFSVWAFVLCSLILIISVVLFFIT